MLALAKEKTFDFCKNRKGHWINTFPMIDSEEEISPDLNIVFASHQKSFKGRNQPLKVSNKETPKERIKFDIIDRLTFCLNEDLIVDLFY